MNWGKGIAIALTMFIIFIVVLVVILISQSVDLETEDYYKKDIAYQTEITAMENAINFKDAPEIEVTSTHIIVKLNENHKLTNVQLRLNRPNNEKLDQTINIEGTNTFTLNKSDLVKGVYKLELSYEYKGKAHLQREEHYI